LLVDPKQSKQILERYQQNPADFFVEILGIQREHIWSKMHEIVESVRDNERTTVRAGHSVSKTFTAAQLVMWFLYSFYPATVITTAPSQKQVEEILWREIREAHSNAIIPLGGHVTKTKIDLEEKWFAYGFSTKPDNVTQQATGMQGYHNDNVLLIFDEAAGIMSKIWEAAEALMTSGFVRMLAIGNPTSAFGEFIQTFEPGSGYHPIVIGVKDTPNYKSGQELIPGLSGRRYEEAMRKKYGVNSNVYRTRVDGEIPTYIEGTIYGKAMAQLKDKKRFVDIPPDESALVHTSWDLGIGDSTTIWFFRVSGLEIHWLDYYENSGEGLAHYAQIITEKKEENNWMYGKHFAPFDIENRSLSTGSTRKETARKLGLPLVVVERMSLENGIQLVRETLPRSWFDNKKTAVGCKGLSEYRWKKNVRLSSEDRAVFSNIPEHDWPSHASDGFRYGCIAIANNLRQGSMTPKKAKELELQHARPS
jgi:hypothetical protein